MIEAAMVAHQLIELALAGMAERRVAEIMGERQGFGQVLVEPERPGDGAGDLGDLDRMGESGAVMIALVIDEDLGLVLEPAEGGGMDDAVAVALEGGARRASGSGREPAAALAGSGRIGASAAIMRSWPPG